MTLKLDTNSACSGTKAHLFTMVNSEVTNKNGFANSDQAKRIRIATRSTSSATLLRAKRMETVCHDIGIYTGWMFINLV